VVKLLEIREIRGNLQQQVEIGMEMEMELELEKEKEKEKEEMEKGKGESLVHQATKHNDHINELSTASSRGDMEMLRSLVEVSGCHLSLPDGGGYYPLQWAALNDRFEAANYLILVSFLCTARHGFFCFLLLLSICLLFYLAFL
jgi:hypothetical protein